MKLLTKFSIYNIGFSLVVFMIGGVLIYHFLYKIANDQTDESLRRDVAAAINKMKTGVPAGDLETPILHIRRIDRDPVIRESVADTIIYNPKENEQEPYRILRTAKVINHTSYVISIMQPMIERNDVILTIFLSTLTVCLILILLISVSNIVISRRLWSPFRKTLEGIRRYRLSSNFKFQPSETRITEFNELNDYVNEMISRVENEYNALKEFTSNASHEMQTPLAVLRSKIELLSQTEMMASDQSEHLLAINQAVSRMTKLYRALLLLTKLENRQFEEISNVNLNGVIKRIIQESKEFILLKDLKVTYSEDGELVVNMNPDLAKIMLRNLVSNAIRHSEERGSIQIVTTPTEIQISNTGQLVFDKNPREIFERFKKNPDSKGSIGLGLSIVQKICELYSFTINYEFTDNWHHFEIQIPT